MSNHKQDRIQKKRDKRAAKKARQRDRAASEAQNNETTVAVAEPEPVKQVKTIVRPSAELIEACKSFGQEFKGAIVAFLNHRFEDSRDFLLAAKAERKAANRLIANPKLKIKRTKIRAIETAIVEAEHEAEEKAKQAERKAQSLRLAHGTIQNLFLSLPESRELSSKTLEILSMRSRETATHSREKASTFLMEERQDLIEIQTIAAKLSARFPTLSDKIARLNGKITELNAKIDLFEVNLVWSDRRKRPGSDGSTLDVIAIRRDAPARVKALAKRIKGKNAPITKLAEPVISAPARMAG